MKKLYVGNLSYDSTEDKLRELFEGHGQVNSVAIITDRATGQSRGFGFIEMSNDNEADAAIEALNQSQFDGRQLVVNVARPPKSGGGGGGGSRGGQGGGGGGRGRDRRW